MKYFQKLLILIAVAVSSLNMYAQFGETQAIRKMKTTMHRISTEYVDKVDEDKLAEDAVKALLEKLDPHSTYISADEVKEMNEPLEGNFDGIGVSFNMLTDTLYIVETISGGPSEKVGIRAGDRIINVNDTLIAGVKMSNRDIMKRLRGPKGTTVRVQVLRRGEPELIDFKITRDKIPIYSLDASYMIDKKTGYIRLSRFGATTINEFKKALSGLQAQGMSNLILDLQYNGGGYLSAATGIVNEFLGKDKLIVYTEGEHQRRYSDVSNAKGNFEKGKLVVLVNESSASASEIVSGAVQDWDRGLIVGRRTFGKGLVQRQFSLADGSMIRLTVARYYTPSGRSIQKPYENGAKGDYEQDLIERFNHGEMVSADSIHFPDSLKFKTLVKGRTVYGGGGIMPDEFVPLDTARYTDYHMKLNSKGLINKIVLGILDNEREKLLAQYPTIEEYKAEYKVPKSAFETLKKYAEEEKIEFKEDQYSQSKEDITIAIKALVARDIYNAAAYYRIINDHSDVFKRGLEIINNDKLYNQLLGGG
ncbi:PDZ domain-containing protein [Dysgonomonas sp. 520]|nr:PDZ domain-containing protein [Dysgonomonas sp. 520]